MVQERNLFLTVSINNSSTQKRFVKSPLVAKYAGHYKIFETLKSKRNAEIILHQAVFISKTHAVLHMLYDMQY